MLNLILSILFSSILYLFDNNSIQACDFLYTSWFEYHSSLNFCLVLELPLELEGKGNHAIGQVGAGKKKKSRTVTSRLAAMAQPKKREPTRPVTGIGLWKKEKSTG